MSHSLNLLGHASDNIDGSGSGFLYSKVTNVKTVFRFGIYENLDSERR